MSRIDRFITRSVAMALPLLLAQPAGAAPAFDVWKPGATCFARSYDARHLASHPKQRLTRFALGAGGAGQARAKGTFGVTIGFQVRGRSARYEADASCRGGPRTARCTIEGDGGQFTMTADAAGLLLTVSRIAVEGETDFSPEIGVGGDDRLVRLHSAPASACRFN